MTQVIIYTNDNGNVSVCVPTGEVPIEEVLANNCPEGAMVIDSSELPADDDFFDAWRLVGGEVVVDLEAAKEVHIRKINELAIKEAESRNLKKAIGVAPALSDAQFIALLDSRRDEVNDATDLQGIRAVSLQGIVSV